MGRGARRWVSSTGRSPTDCSQDCSEDLHCDAFEMGDEGATCALYTKAPQCPFTSCDDADRPSVRFNQLPVTKTDDMGSTRCMKKTVTHKQETSTCGAVVEGFVMPSPASPAILTALKAGECVFQTFY